MTAIVLRGDARQLPLPDASVDLIVTSPPYWALRSYTDGGRHYAGQIGDEPTPQEYIDNLLTCTAEWTRVLKPEGSIFVVLGDKYSDRADGGPSSARTYREDRAEALPPGRSSTAAAPRRSRLLLPERYRIACVDRLGLIVRAVIIWHKPTAMPESVTNRVRTVHEDVVHLVKQERYFAALDEIREPLRAPRRKAGAKAFGARNTCLTRTATGDYEGQNPRGAVPGSVWEIATQPLRVPEHLGVDHFAVFPPALVRRIVLGWSPAGGTVLDPFGGTGTTALVADVLGRRGVTVDRSADYCRIAAWRTTDRGERARALGLPKPPPEPEGMSALFDLEASWQSPTRAWAFARSAR